VQDAITIPSVTVDLRQILATYESDGYAYLPRLLTANDATRLLATTTSVAIERVNCGDDTIRFGEQNFADDHPVARFFAGEPLVRLALSLTRDERVRHLTCWTSVYRVGEFINPHTDAIGDIQVLLCLKAPPAEANAGHLILRADTSQQVSLALRPGDAVVFDATSIRHCTTPLTRSPENPEPLRVVAVGRYFTTIAAIAAPNADEGRQGPGTPVPGRA